MTWTKPQYLVETDWLAMHLDDPALRLLECTAILHPRPEGGYRAESGRSIWAAGPRGAGSPTSPTTSVTAHRGCAS